MAHQNMCNAWPQMQSFGPKCMQLCDDMGPLLYLKNVPAEHTTFQYDLKRTLKQRKHINLQCYLLN